MGISIKVFFVEEGDKLRRITLKRYEAIYFEPENAEPFPEYAGQKIKCALVIFNNENRKPSVIRKIDYSYITFDETGRLNRDEWDRQAHLSVNLLDGMLSGNCEKSQDNLIDADYIFAQNRYKNEFRWKASAELEKAIINAVFVEKKVVKKHHLRLVWSSPVTDKSI